ncbi:MAG: hypothetical protein JJU27_00580 [Gammaproteobacteria bacterium]|nr:hypothetical protein [Gammaproteobacteria bacterium]
MSVSAEPDGAVQQTQTGAGGSQVRTSMDHEPTDHAALQHDKNIKNQRLKQTVTHLA